MTPDELWHSLREWVRSWMPCLLLAWSACRGQLIRSGTALRPNYDEGCAAESPLTLSTNSALRSKSKLETCGWLGFIISLTAPGKTVALLLDEGKQLTKIIGRSIVTAKSKRRQHSSSLPTI